jgi:hypothetical protein
MKMRDFPLPLPLGLSRMEEVNFSSPKPNLGNQRMDLFLGEEQYIRGLVDLGHID